MPLTDELRVAAALAPDSPVLAAIQDHYGEQGTIVTLGEDSDLDALAGESWSLIVVDWRVEPARSFVEAIKVSRRTSRTPVVAIYEEGSTLGCYRPMVIEPDLEVAEPVDAKALMAQTDRLLERQRTRPRHFFQDLVVRLGTDDDEIDRAHEFYDRLLEELGYSEYDQVTLSHSFREALGNAAEHGNKKDPDRMLRIATIVDHEKVAFVVTDEGPGFDHVAYMQKANNESALATTKGRDENVRPGGLGVHIMKTACDAIEFNDSGNSIFLMKYLPGVKDEGEGEEAGEG